MTKLRHRMIEDMRLRGLAEGTQQVYVEAVKHLAAHYGRSPDQLTEDEVRDFILHPTETRKLAKSTVRVHLFAIEFLYRRTFQRSWPVLSLARLKKPNRPQRCINLVAVPPEPRASARAEFQTATLSPYGAASSRLHRECDPQGVFINVKSMPICAAWP